MITNQLHRLEEFQQSNGLWREVNIKTNAKYKARAGEKETNGAKSNTLSDQNQEAVLQKKRGVHMGAYNDSL